MYSLLSVSWTDNPLSVDYSIDSDELFVRLVGSIDWENAAWQDMAEVKQFEDLVCYLSGGLGVNMMSGKAHNSVEDIRSRLNNEEEEKTTTKTREA